jgi:Flp pilus assembly pilin Flp
MSSLAFWVDDKGAATAEYAIATMAAVGFAGLLVVIMRSDEVRTILFDLVKSALTFTNPNDAPTQ